MTESKRPCPDKPCQKYKHKDQAPSLKFAEDVNACLHDRPVLHAGVLWIGAMRRFFVPRSCTRLPAEPRASVASKDVGQLAPSVGQQTIISEPIVSEDSSEEKYEEVKSPQSPTLSEVRGQNQPLEVSFQSQIQDSYEQITKRAQDFSQEVNAATLQIYEATSEPIKNILGPKATTYRCMAISSSGLGGYVLGIPANIRTRAVYAATGVIAMATLCYPEETRHYLDFIRDSVEQGTDLVRSVSLNTPNAERENDFAKNQEDDHNTLNKRNWNTPVYDTKRDDVGLNIDYVEHPPEQCPDLTAECKTLPFDHVSSQLSHKCKSKNAINEMSLASKSTDDSSSTSADPGHKEDNIDLYSYTQSISKDIFLEDVEGNEQQADESTNECFELQDDQTLPNVVETTDDNVDSIKQTVLKEKHDSLTVLRQPNESFAHSFEKQQKNMVDSSADDYDDLYTRRT